MPERHRTLSGRPSSPWGDFLRFDPAGEVGEVVADGFPDLHVSGSAAPGPEHVECVPGHAEPVGRFFCADELGGGLHC